jgi:hypothetical protein
MTVKNKINIIYTTFITKLRARHSSNGTAKVKMEILI